MKDYRFLTLLEDRFMTRRLLIASLVICLSLCCLSQTQAVGVGIFTNKKALVCLDTNPQMGIPGATVVDNFQITYSDGTILNRQFTATTDASGFYTSSCYCPVIVGATVTDVSLTAVRVTCPGFTYKNGGSGDWQPPPWSGTASNITMSQP